MASSFGDLKLGIYLDLRPFSESIKSAQNMLRMFGQSADEILKLKSPSFGAADFEAEIKKLDASLENYKSEAKQSTDATDKLAQEHKQAAVATGKHGEAIVTLQSKLQNVALRVQGFQSILQMLRSTFGGMVAEYNKQEIALARLEQGLKNVGEGAGSLKKLTKQAADLQNITPFADEEINNAQATLTTFQKTSGEIQILIPQILNLAAARMQDGG